MVNNTFIYSDIHTYSSVEIVCVMYSVGSVLFYYNRESWGAALQLSFGSFLEPITKIIEAHARKLLITHCAKLFWIPSNLQWMQENGIRTLSLISLNRRGLVGFKSSFLRFFILSLWCTHIICIFHFQRIFEIKINVNFSLNLYMKPFEVPQRNVRMKN